MQIFQIFDYKKILKSRHKMHSSYTFIDHNYKLMCELYSQTYFKITHM